MQKLHKHTLKKKTYFFKGCDIDFIQYPYQNSACFVRYLNFNYQHFCFVCLFVCLFFKMLSEKQNKTKHKTMALNFILPSANILF